LIQSFGFRGTLDGKVRTAVVMILLAGCFPPNLGEGRITCGDGKACPPGYLCRLDNYRCYTMGFTGSGGTGGSGDMSGSVTGDLAGAGMSDLAGAEDMATISGGCGPTVSRVCADIAHSATCVMNGNVWVPMPDRTCPTGSLCSSGVCQPPGLQLCTRNADCTAPKVCVQYASGSTLTGYCTTQSSNTAPGNNMKCPTVGYYDKCATGICAAAANDTTIKGCLNPCVTMADCAGKMCNPVGGPVSVEGGTTSTLHFCAP
jgi:hypothetical protein